MNDPNRLVAKLGIPQLSQCHDRLLWLLRVSYSLKSHTYVYPCTCIVRGIIADNHHLSVSRWLPSHISGRDTCVYVGLDFLHIRCCCNHQYRCRGVYASFLVYACVQWQRVQSLSNHHVLDIFGLIVYACLKALWWRKAVLGWGIICIFWGIICIFQTGTKYYPYCK